MCKIQAFGLLAVTLLLFLQESSGTDDNRIQILTAAVKDIRNLSESTKKWTSTTYRMPQNIPENCSLNALACFADRLSRIQYSLRSHKQINKHADIGHIITNIQSYLEKTLHHEVKPEDLQPMCDQCDFGPTMLKTVPTLLGDLLNLLQRVAAKL